MSASLVNIFYGTIKGIAIYGYPHSTSKQMPTAFKP